MAKALRTVGTVVGAAVAIVGVATGQPWLVAAGTKIVTYSNIAATAIDMINPPKFQREGSPTTFQTNPQSGLP